MREGRVEMGLIELSRILLAVNCISRRSVRQEHIGFRKSDTALVVVGQENYSAQFYTSCSNYYRLNSVYCNVYMFSNKEHHNVICPSA
jgi:hypothetical protein